MNAPVFPERLLRPPDGQAALPLASAGVQRVVWASRYGEILIEVIDGEVRVNGDLVLPAEVAPAEPKPPEAVSTPPVPVAHVAPALPAAPLSCPVQPAAGYQAPGLAGSPAVPAAVPAARQRR